MFRIKAHFCNSAAQQTLSDISRVEYVRGEGICLPRDRALQILSGVQLRALPSASTAHRASYHTYAIDYWNMRRAPLRRCARGPIVVGPAALEAINLSAALPYVVELHEAPEGCV